jgi:thiol-disulfide isomerase/thioredoxin
MRVARKSNIAIPLLLITVLFTVASCHGETKRSENRSSPSSAAALPGMVMLTSGHCPICRQMEPLMGELIAKCDNNGVSVNAIDVTEDENEHLIEEYRVVGVPTFLFRDAQGREVARLVGAQTEQALVQGLTALRGEECPGMTRLDI